MRLNGDMDLRKLGYLWGHNLSQEYDLVNPGRAKKCGSGAPAVTPSFLHPRGCSPWS